MKNTLLPVLLAFKLSSFVRGFDAEDYSCGLYCISGIITSFGTVLTICICCTCCVSIVLIFKQLCGNNAISNSIIRSHRNDVEIGIQCNHIAANPADPPACEPALDYDDVVNMDSLPPYIPGYTYNANIVNTNYSANLSTGTGGEQTIYLNTQEVPQNNQESVSIQDAVFSIEFYADTPFPPPYSDTRDNDAIN